jgi:16S rRNA (uracil1498-N3)-methyltransferase
MARRRWIADTWDATTATLLGAQAQHLARVLRAEPGMRCDVVAGDQVWSAVITHVNADPAHSLVVMQLDQQLAADHALPLTLLLAVFKFDRLEWAIEKATELGVARIVPVIARRTEKHLAQSAAARVERWRRIAHEAAKQSRRADLPTIDDPAPLKTLLEQTWPGARLLLAENEKRYLLRDALAQFLDGSENAATPNSSNVTLAIGPEGGWTLEEEQLFATHLWSAVSMGPRILRAETAAIAATSIVASALIA